MLERKLSGLGHNGADNAILHGVGQMPIDLNDPAHPGHSNHVISCDGKYARRVWVPDVPLLESVKSELLDIAESHMFECCGFIDSRWDVWKIPNTHKSPMRNYYMDQEDAEPVLTYIYQDIEETVIAIWHTHPNGAVWPSPRDIRGWPNLALGWRYLIVTPNEICEWELTNERP